MIDLSGEEVLSLALKPTSLDDVKALFSAGELEMLETEETSMAYTVKPKIYLRARIQTAYSLMWSSARALETQRHIAQSGFT